VSETLGFSGRLARAFIGRQLTPLLALAALLAGAFAVLVTPREEEPQIDVTFANVLVPFPGASARPSCASTTPSTRTRTGSPRARACCSHWSNRKASTTFPSSR
jgi:hypothetical protein